MDGQAEPGRLRRHDCCRPNGTLTGRRLAALIGLRDHARRVLQSQNEGWPETHRDDARRELNRAYDRFVAAYGPINKTTFSETADGTVIRRMPNLVKFREDPDAMLVMSLEEYDEVTGKATKAAIMTKDVVGTNAARHPRSTAPRKGCWSRSNQRGTVDLPYIATLYGKPEDEIIAELGDLIYRDPESEDLADGRRLPLRQRAGEARRRRGRRPGLRPQRRGPAGRAAGGRAARRHRRQPRRPVDTGGRHPGVRRRPVPRRAVLRSTIGHLKKDAVWSLDADYAAEQSVAATSEYGTPRANGTWLLELALNMKTPVIYDTVNHGDREERVVNQEATLAAREKQKLIKERFRSWVFADPERTERLVRLYNDTYNNLRPRLFDGSHLDFPGMNQTITLRPHQKDAVWRGMSSGNTLLAHAVGAGKTFTMAATGMKMKQAGLIQEADVRRAQPPARAVRPRVHAALPQRQAARRRQGGLDAGPPQVPDRQDRQRRVGRDHRHPQLVRADRHVAGLPGAVPPRADRRIRPAAPRTRRPPSAANRNLIKTIEKQKAGREERLKDLLAEDKKDDGLVFDELGVDHVFIDEAHYFKNLETPTKMERVAGIQTGGSERAFDLLHEGPLPARAAPRPRRHVRHRHADQQHDGRDVHDAAVPRPRGAAGARHRALRRLGGDVRRSRRHDGDLAGRVPGCPLEPRGTTQPLFSQSAQSKQ